MSPIWKTLTLSVVIPTFNEGANIEVLFAELTDALRGLNWEVIFVDDNSPDRTADTCRGLADKNTNVRVIQRVKERGLCSAVHVGVQAAHGRFIVVMDGDLQHEPFRIPTMLDALEQGADIVVCSRFLKLGGHAGLSSELRIGISKFGNVLTNALLKRRLSDPLSGFFATRRLQFLSRLPHMQADGFKVLFDLLHYSPTAKVVEIPFDFRIRQEGESNLQLNTFWLLLCDVIAKMTFGIMPPRFVSFILVGAIGAVSHFSVFYLCLALMVRFPYAQATAAIFAMSINFWLNNQLTYRDSRLYGIDFFQGLLAYALTASLGIFANVSAATWTFENLKVTTFLASAIGIMIDTVWRFGFANRLIWARREKFKIVHGIERGGSD